ncbi:PaaI family thioesterase [Aspergillus affinis]|uniref:PaaI family thioesterase n=1 Tax=Aspergillus affinis TaxID=1070780 RepID=UPI0022FE380A|nr:thioesterase [Aspergillus affinis]KAI9037921.1 thioesterase [Aspergillus affinis]
MTGLLSAPPDFERRVFGIFERYSQDSKGRGWDYNPENYNARIEAISPGSGSSDSSPPSVAFRFIVTEDMCNYTHHLHGGCVTTILDTLSSIFLVALSKPGLYSLGGVSRHLHTTYLRPIPVGKEVRLVCSLKHAGKKLVLLKANLYRVDDDRLCVIGINEKANTDPPRESKI